jgi:hypothetical protein
MLGVSTENPKGAAETPPSDDLVERLREIAADELQAMYEAAAEATKCLAALAQAGKNPVTEAIDGADMVGEWAHFPQGDVIDNETRSQYYYHAHAAEERVEGEHGHFHTFVRHDGATADDDKPRVTHLVGISTDASGRLIRLFTTNRWVTDEIWSDADNVIGMLDRFDITVDKPSPELNRWVSATLRMFRPQIVDLINARDARIAQFKAAHPDSDVYEDRALQVTSEIPVDFLAQIRAIETALESST